MKFIPIHALRLTSRGTTAGVFLGDGPQLFSADSLFLIEGLFLSLELVHRTIH